MNERYGAPPPSSTGRVVAITTIIVLVVAGGLFALFLYWQAQQEIDTFRIVTPETGTSTMETPEPAPEIPDEAPAEDVAPEPTAAPKPQEPKKEETGEARPPASLFAPPGWQAGDASDEKPAEEEKEEAPAEEPAGE